MEGGIQRLESEERRQEISVRRNPRYKNYRKLQKRLRRRKIYRI
jgi:hypothetical protein